MDRMRLQGEIILHAVGYLHRKRGSDGVDAVNRELDFELSDIIPEKWYPFEWYMDVLEHTSTVVNKKGHSMAARIGYDRSKHVGFLKIPQENLKPLWVLGSVKFKWSTFFDFGHVELTKCEPSSVDLGLFDYTSHPQFCERMNGFLKGLLREVCGLENASVEETKCICNGDECCLFETRW